MGARFGLFLVAVSYSTFVYAGTADPTHFQYFHDPRSTNNDCYAIDGDEKFYSVVYSGSSCDDLNSMNKDGLSTSKGNVVRYNTLDTTSVYHGPAKWDQGDGYLPVFDAQSSFVHYAHVRTNKEGHKYIEFSSASLHPELLKEVRNVISAGKNGKNPRLTPALVSDRRNFDSWGPLRNTDYSNAWVRPLKPAEKPPAVPEGVAVADNPRPAPACTVTVTQDSKPVPYDWKYDKFTLFMMRPTEGNEGADLEHGCAYESAYPKDKSQEKDFCANMNREGYLACLTMDSCRFKGVKGDPDDCTAKKCVDQIEGLYNNNPDSIAKDYDKLNADIEKLKNAWEELRKALNYRDKECTPGTNHWAEADKVAGQKQSIYDRILKQVNDDLRSFQSVFAGHVIGDANVHCIVPNNKRVQQDYSKMYGQKDWAEREKFINDYRYLEHVKLIRSHQRTCQAHGFGPVAPPPPPAPATSTSQAPVTQ